MPLVRPDALLRALEKGKRGGVFFLFGDEEYLKEAAVSALVAAHLDPGTRDFNFDQLRASDADPETIGSVLATPPMMAEWRVVVLRDVQALAGSARARAAVEAAAAKPPAGLALILVAQIPDRSRARFYETLKKQAQSAEFAPLSPADVPGWLMQEAEARGTPMDTAAARALAAAIGTELGVLGRELDKLREYAGDAGRITVADVEAVVGVVPRQNRWEWFDLVGDARFADARHALPVLLESSGESGVGLVLGLGTHFLRLALAASGGQRALESALPPHQRWLAGRILKQARRWSVGALQAALEDLLRADRLLKSASLTDRQIMEELLLRMQVRGTPAMAS